MTRTFGNRFNRLYKTDYFIEPHAFSFSKQLVKIPGLDGKGKMGKSEGEANAVYLSDRPEVIRKKVMRAVTDSGPTTPNQPKPDAIQNLFTLMEAVSTPDTVSHFDELYNTCQIRYGDLKEQLAEDMVAATAPVRARIAEISNDNDYISKVVRQGNEKARESARKTIEDVRRIIGFKKF